MSQQKCLFLYCLFCLLAGCQQVPQTNGPDLPLSTEGIILSDAQIQLANIQTTVIGEDLLGSELSLTGVLRVDEQSAVMVTSRSSGRIQKVFYKNTGDHVQQGDTLYQLYSEELVAAQREYVALQRNNWNASGRYEPSLVLENKLLYLGMLPPQLAQLRKDGHIFLTIPILSPAGGTIRSVKVTDNQYVEDGQLLFELADDQKLWVEAQVYPDDLAALQTGMPCRVTIPAAVTTTVASRIIFISPSFEKGSTFTLVRAAVDNRDRTLYPGMPVRVTVPLPRHHGLVIPSSALIMDKRGRYVWIQNKDASFSHREVTIGPETEDSVIIASGLDPLEKVVTSGVYLLNSEYLLKKGK